MSEREREEDEPCGWWDVDAETGSVEHCASGKTPTFGNCGFSPASGFCEDHRCRCTAPHRVRWGREAPGARDAPADADADAQAVERAADPRIELRWKKMQVRLAAARARLALLEPDGPSRGAERASGALICETCQLSYYDHAEHPFGATFMILCDGSVVKV